MIDVQIKGIEIHLETDPGLFSPKSADRGTLLMLDHVFFSPEDIVLDLGCGYGLVGIYAAKCIPPGQVYMTDMNPLAVRITAGNLHQNNVEEITLVQGNAYEAIDRSDFTLILSNPPYHSDFAVAKTFIEKGFNRLCINGCFFMVTRRKEWYKKKFISVFGGVRIREEEGYFIFMAEKKTDSYANTLHHKQSQIIV